MKIMLISEEWNFEEQGRILLDRNTVAFVHYQSAIKALDNLREINADFVVINVRDFPRHWKVVAQHICSTSVHTGVLLAVGSSEEKTIRAEAVAIDADIKLLVTDVPETELGDLIITHVHAQAAVISHACFSASYKGNVLDGEIVSVTANALVLRPYQKRDLPLAGDLLDNCKLSIHDTMLYPICSVLKSTELLHIKLDWRGISKKALFMRLADELQKEQL